MSVVASYVEAKQRRDLAAEPPRPVPLPVRSDAIPAELKAEARWVGWRFSCRDTKWTKVPFVATEPSREASATSPATWRSFQDAMTSYGRGLLDGIGFVLGDGFVGYDVDETPDEGAWQNIRLLDSYTEYSPSGKGVHVIATGQKPGSRCRVGRHELYDKDRYFTVTGHRVPELAGSIHERTDAIADLYARLFESEDAAGEMPHVASRPPALADDDLLARARAAKNGAKFSRLWQGDTSEHGGDDSAADLALCCLLAFWADRDASTIDRLFRRSGLMRAKWDSRRGESTWGRELIAKAIEQTPTGYAGGHKPKPTPPTRELVVEDVQAFLARLEGEPPLGWYVPGLIPDEGICLWHGQPRDFKSMCAQEMALALATGRTAFAIARFAVAAPVRVAYFTEEDPERLFAARMRWLTARSGIPVPRHLFPFVRKSLSFDVEEDRTFILDVIRETGAQVAVFDPVRSYTGHADKGPADLRPVALFLRQVQNETTAKTLLLVHHDTKPPAISPEGEQRSRSQQASGGGIFSISDCPVSFSKLDWNKVAVYPEDYKLSGDPKAFEVTFETDVQEGDDGPRFGTWVRPIAVTKDERDIANGVLAKKILAFLRSSAGTWHSTEDVGTGAHVGKMKVGAILEQLHEERRVRFCTGDDAKLLGRKHNAKLWGAEDDEQPPLPDCEM